MRKRRTSMLKNILKGPQVPCRSSSPAKCLRSGSAASRRKSNLRRCVSHLPACPSRARLPCRLCLCLPPNDTPRRAQVLERLTQQDSVREAKMTLDHERREERDRQRAGQVWLRAAAQLRQKQENLKIASLEGLQDSKRKAWNTNRTHTTFTSA